MSLRETKQLQGENSHADFATASFLVMTKGLCLQILRQLFQHFSRYFLKIKHQETIQAISKFGVDIKANDTGIQRNVLP